MVTVELRDNESQQQLLQRFRKKVQRERVLGDARKKRWFMSESEKKRVALRKARRRERKRQFRAQRRMFRY